ncbi:MAG: DUF2309 domain-containing protein [Vulcanimicrobiota bacterium]
MTAEDIVGIVKHVAHWLPTQGPIKEFVHHNTLHAYQNYTFYEGCLTASRMYAARAFLPLSEYRAYFSKGRINEAALHEVLLEETQGNQAEALKLRERLNDSRLEDETLPRGIAKDGLRARWREKRNLALKLQTHPILFRLIGQFLDQGVSIWRMPHTQFSLYESVGKIVQESWIPLWPYSNPQSRRYLEMQPQEAILDILKQFVGDEQYFERYLLEMSLAHPGWSGMVHMIETEPQGLVLRRKVSLLEFCALELIAEHAVVTAKFGTSFPPLLAPGETLPPLPVHKDYVLEWTETERLQKIWHEAYERSYYVGVLTQISEHRGRGAISEPSVQAFFCIDDRECSLRRHLEEVAPSVQTFAWAGFFGIDCVFQGADDAFPFKHCPVPVQPKHLIREVKPAGHKPRASWLSRLLQLDSDPGSQTLVRGMLISQTLGLASALRLAFSIFRPVMSPLTASSLRRVDQEAELQIERTSEELQDGYLVGYTVPEMAERVYNILRASGAQARPLAELVVFYGHGASSVNNPYFAAYDCGACSGKPGAPNARAFALMANRPDVRALVKEKGYDIGERTWFVGALHDTTRDEVQYYELDRVPAHLSEKLKKFQADMETALGRNAKERCLKFVLVDTNVTPEQAREEVRRRSTGIFEPRPELNHATNAGTIVGRRALTRGLNFDRRMFLNSYDPDLDPSGDTLAGILGAVVPVCGGINLEYFFSRLDCRVYGAGSKLPHNINGLIGVMNGTEGDLLTGLPTQMTEVHEPIRLTLLVQQTPETALKAAQKSPAVYEWIMNGWVRYFAIDPASFEVYEYRGGSMVRMKLGSSTVAPAAPPPAALATSAPPLVQVGGSQA